MNGILKEAVSGFTAFINKIDKQELLWFLFIFGLVGSIGFGYLIVAHPVSVTQFTYWIFILSTALMLSSLFTLNQGQRQILSIKKEEKKHIDRIKAFWDSIEHKGSKLLLYSNVRLGIGIDLESDPIVNTLLRRTGWGKWDKIQGLRGGITYVFHIKDEILIDIICDSEMLTNEQLEILYSAYLKAKTKKEVESEPEALRTALAVVATNNFDIEKINTFFEKMIDYPSY